MNGDFDYARLIYLLMALLLVLGGGWGFSRYRHNMRAVIASIAFWAGLIVAIVLAYNAFS